MLRKVKQQAKAVQGNALALNWRRIFKHGSRCENMLFITLDFVSINHFKVCLFSLIQILLAASAALISPVSHRLARSMFTHHTWDNTSLPTMH